MNQEIVLWGKLKHLFEPDGGSCPDIFIDEISPTEIKLSYNYILSIARVRSGSTLFETQGNRDIPIANVADPVQMYFDGKCQTFRHGLFVLDDEESFLNHLTIEICTSNGFSIDFQRGSFWNSKNVYNLFLFLSQIKEMCPGSKIWQADEGRSDFPNVEFETTFLEFHLNRRD